MRLFLIALLAVSSSALVVRDPLVRPDLTPEVYQRLDLYQQQARDYFSFLTRDSKPRLELLIGLPGSGKSQFTIQAARAGFAVISVDEIRVQELTTLNRTRQYVRLPSGRYVRPHPRDPVALFSNGMLSNPYFLGLRRLLDILKTNQSVVYDATNLDSSRFRLIEGARWFGYSVGAVVFQSSDHGIKVHSHNIQYRISKGGLDLVATGPQQVQRRETLLMGLKEIMDIYRPEHENFDDIEYAEVLDWWPLLITGPLPVPV